MRGTIKQVKRVGKAHAGGNREGNERQFTGLSTAVWPLWLSEGRAFYSLESVLCVPGFAITTPTPNDSNKGKERSE